MSIGRLNILTGKVLVFIVMVHTVAGRVSVFIKRLHFDRDGLYLLKEI